MANKVTGHDCPICPYCKTPTDDVDDYGHVVTYWGEGPGTVTCPSCDKDYIADEIIKRKWICSKKD